MMECKPRRVRCKLEQNIVLSEDDKFLVLKEIVEENKKQGKKLFDDDQVKMMWDVAMLDCDHISNVKSGDSKYEFDVLDEYQDVDENEFINLQNFDSSELNDFDRFQDEAESGTQEEPSRMEWNHMYPIRKSLYNRKTHFISFLQNYTTYDMGRKLMSEYENTMCDFILLNMKPSTSDDLLMMLKECKLSNVYRFYKHIFNRWFVCEDRYREFEIKPKNIDRIVHLFLSFENFFHRNHKFGRKNFLSMRFLLGRILLYLKIVKCELVLPIDLQRPKGKSQFSIHMQVWNNFLASL